MVGSIKTFESMARENRMAAAVALPFTCNDAEYFTSDAWLLATHVYSPECECERDGILRMEVY
jgi:hypothetical protein